MTIELICTAMRACSLAPPIHLEEAGIEHTKLLLLAAFRFVRIRLCIHNEGSAALLYGYINCDVQNIFVCSFPLFLQGGNRLIVSF